MLSLRRSLLPLLALVLALAPRAVRAAESAVAVSPRARVALLSDADRLAPGQAFQLGLWFRLAPGWHIYWRNPGDAGAPPGMRLDLPPGATAGPIAWPAPRPVREGPLTAYAYTGSVLLARTVRLPAGPAAGATVPILARAHWLVCKDICVPEQARFRLDLPLGTPQPAAQAPLFATAAQDVPRPSPWDATVAPDARLWLHGPGFDPAAVARARFIPDRGGAIDNDAAQPLARTPHGIVLRLTPGTGFSPTAALTGVVELADRGGGHLALAVRARPGPVPAARARPTPGRGLWRLLGFGFLGGLILNLMPCVFPVLAMKAVALARGAAEGRMRPLALSYTLGVLTAFAALGGALLLLRAGGMSAGWGFQFASPTAVAAMALVLFAVGLNLSGVFATWDGMAGLGQGLTSRGGHVGSFCTGLLAVVVATPCTAPFMAVAIGGALALPPAAALAVFLAIGAGLAAPMATLGLAPGLGRWLPRPGHWMVTLRQVLAFPMYAATVWLVSVVSTEAGSSGVLAAGAALVLVGFAAWVLGLAQRGPVPGRRVRYGLAGLSGIGALVVLGALARSPAATAAGSAAPASRTVSALPGARAFSAARLAALRTAGRGVFVDMTASWCLICQLNERIALAPARVRAAFVRGGYVPLVGDWTRQDPAISAYLRAHGRAGVPLYVVYRPGVARGTVLPQLLTPGLVLHALAAR